MTLDPATVKELFNEVSTLPAEQRSADLDEACRDQPEIRAWLEALLAVHGEPDHLLDPPEVVDQQTLD